MENKPLLHLFKHLHDRVAKETNTLLAQEDITFSQGPIIHVLSRSPNYTASLKHLEKKINLAQSTIVGLVSRLEAKQFVKTYPDPTDKRAKVVTLTEKGINIADTLHQHISNLEQEFLAVLSDEEKEVFIRLITKLENQFVQEAEKV